MIIASRVWVALIGLLSILSVYPHWFKLETLVTERGVQAIDGIGRTNVRADMGGIFLAIGILALLAAGKRSTAFLAAATLVPASAFAGRLISLALDGYQARVLQPLVVEAVVLTLFVLAYRMWKKAPEGL